MRTLGRGLQLAGLALAPLAIVMQLAEAISVKQMLTFAVAAVCMFWIGRIVEGYGR